MEINELTKTIVNDYLKATNKTANTLSVGEYIMFRQLAREEYENGLAYTACASKNQDYDAYEKNSDTETVRVNHRPLEEKKEDSRNPCKITDIRSREMSIEDDEDIDEEENDMLSLLRSVKG